MASPISPSSVGRDKTYYIPSGDVVFLVQNILYRVHRYFFDRESSFFKTMFETPPPKNEPVPGSSDSCALILEDVTAAEFSRFVWIFYNPKFSLYDEASVDDWKSILELSTRWLFPEIKQLAIRELQKKPLTPIQRIQLYHKNAVDRKLLIGDYLTLCERPEPLSLNEGLDLGLETTLMIARTREDIRSPRSPTGVVAPLTPTLYGSDLTNLIGKLFVGEETKDASITIIAEPTPKPNIVINGHTESRDNSVQTPGGLGKKEANKPEAAKDKTKKNQQNQKKDKNQDSKGKQTPETPKTGGRNMDKKDAAPEQSAAGQQGGGSGGELKDGENGGGNSENDNKLGVGKGDATPVVTNGGTGKTEGGNPTTPSVENPTGEGDMGTGVNGVEDKDKVTTGGQGTTPVDSKP